MVIESTDNPVFTADFTQTPRPFKNPNWRAPRRRHKTLKQMLTDEQRRLQSETTNLSINSVTYFNIEAPPSLKPRKWYCDITGLPGIYKSPASGLRYYNMEVYDVIKGMAPGVDQQYLELRSANVVLR